MSTWPTPQSRVEAILENILGASWPIVTPLSRGEALLIGVLQEIKNIAPKTQVAKTAADMTDTERFYVYIGDETGYTYGDWYYYDPDDEEWKDGGVYQSTGVELDTTLTETGVAAEAAATGDAISSLQTVANGAVQKTYYEELTQPTEDDATANHNIPANTFFMVNNCLYRSTRQIPAGTTISTSTNCERFSLSDALNTWINFDSTPTAGSLKAVTSDGIKTALDTKMDTISIDETPTSGSNNLVRSNGVYDMDEFLRNSASDIRDCLVDETRLRLTLYWTNGGIDNQAGTLINNGSTARCRDTRFFNGAKLNSVQNNSSSVLWIILYTKNSNNTYTFSNSRSLEPGASFNFTTTKWVRFDLRGPRSEGQLIKVYWKTKATEDAHRLMNSVAPIYSSSETYAVGDYVMYDGIWNGGLYECITAIETPEEWTAAHWTAVKVSGEIDELKNNKADVITGTVGPSDIASFPDGAAALAKSVVVGIEPVQAGSGDPSPDNIRPITGWTGANVWDDPVHGGIINWNQLCLSSTGTYTAEGVTTQIDAATHKVTITNNSRTTNYSTGSTQVHLTSIAPIEGHKYYYSSNSMQPTTGVVISTANGSELKGESYSLGSIITAPADATTFRLRLTSAYDFVSAHPVNDVFSFYLNIFDLTQMFGAGNEPTAREFHDIFPSVWYAPNSGVITCASAVNGRPYHAYSISWQSEAGTIYGGELDVMSGVLTVKWVNIASYNGETLPGEWISDRDVYAEGTTPTTGAQVVYKLTTPAIYVLTPDKVKTFLGQNNVFCDTGKSTIEYRADTKKYIDKKLEALVAQITNP